MAFLSGLAGAAHSDTLQDALSEAYTTSPQLRAEQALLRATDEAIPQALSNYRPSISVFGEQGVDHVGGGPVIPGQRADLYGNFSPAAYGMQFTQPIYRGGRTGAEARRAMNLITSERARLSGVEQAVLLGAATDYFDVLQFQTAAQLARDNESVLTKYLDETRGRFHSGAATGTDVAQAEAALGRAATERRQQEGQLAVAQSDYQRDVGVLPGTLGEPALDLAFPASEDDALSRAAVNNPAVEAADFAEQAAEDDVDMARGELLPTLSLEGVVQHLSDVLRVATSSDSLVVGKGRSDEERIMLRLSIPLFDGGKAYAVSRQAQQIVAQRSSETDLARRTATAAAASSWEKLGQVRSTIDSLQREAAADQAALQGVQDEARIGARTVLDVVNAEETLFRSRMALNQARHDEGVNSYALSAALGELTAAKLSLPVDAYDPAAHLESVRDKWFGFGEDYTPRAAAVEAVAVPGVAKVDSAPMMQQAVAAGSVPSAPSSMLAYSGQASVTQEPNETMAYVVDRRAQADEDASEDPGDRAIKTRARETEATRAKWMERSQDD